MQIRKVKNKAGSDTVTDENLIMLFVMTERNEFFEQLYNRHVGRVYRQCVFIIKDTEIAKDLTQDIFLKLVDKLKNFKLQSRFLTWLSRITYNHCIDHLRLTGRNRQTILPEEQENLLNIGDSSEDDTLITCLGAALNDLPYHERELIFMKYMHNLSLDDIAGIQDISKSAIKMRLLRTREKLREHIDKQLY